MFSHFSYVLENSSLRSKGDDISRRLEERIVIAWPLRIPIIYSMDKSKSVERLNDSFDRSIPRLGRRRKCSCTWARNRTRAGKIRDDGSLVWFEKHFRLVNGVCKHDRYSWVIAITFKRPSFRKSSARLQLIYLRTSKSER